MTQDYLTEDDLRQRPNYSDAKEIRVAAGIPPFWKVEEQLASYQHPLPDAIIHTDKGSRYGHAGGTNWLAVGGKGSGKSTLALWLSTHLLEQNDETVIWRGAEARSEWLPFKRWTTLYLPAGCDIEATWRPESIRRRDETRPADLEDVVREVKRYDGIKDLLSQLESHEFAVVYPDPEFRGCNEAMRESTYVQKEIEYNTRESAEKPSDVTGLVYWWIAFGVGVLEGWGGGYHWTSLVFDEVADLLPQSAEADAWDYVEVFRKIIDDSRKYGFSLFAFGQDEADVHEKVRRKFQWRVAMPDDDGNPAQEDGVSPPVGFSNIPMKNNKLRQKGPGHGYCWKPGNFTPFRWQDIPDWEEDADRKLKINIKPVGGSTHARATESDSDPGGDRLERREVADD